MNEKVLFDTDIGSDIDDALALAYLLKEPRCELLGITTVTSFPEQRAAMCSVICRHAGRPDIPIHVGGPVQTDRGFVLHPSGQDFQATLALGEVALLA